MPDSVRPSSRAEASTVDNELKPAEAGKQTRDSNEVRHSYSGSWGLGVLDRYRVEVRPGGPQGDGVGYSNYDGRAAPLSRRRASSL